MLKIFISFFIFLLITSSAWADAPFTWSGNLYKNIEEFNKIHKQFFKQVCVPGTEFKYYKLLKLYRGQGNYLPLIGDDIDRDAISSNLFHFKNKIAFVSSTLKKLKKNKELPSFKFISQDINLSLKELLEYKKLYNAEISEKKKIEILSQSSKAIAILQKQYEVFLNRVYFLKSYHFPNDHLDNRSEYEKFKDSEKVSDLKKANKIFFYRKIVEDGTYNDNHQRPDLYTRSTLDTLFYELKKENNLISENVRYDLEWIMGSVESLLDEGYSKHVKRLTEWLKRTKESYSFYKDIIQMKNRKKAHKIVKDRNEATINLKKFTYQKQAEVYKFWLTQDPLWQRLFVLETILFNEVGVIDGDDALERKEVAQIVMNRIKDSFYSTLSPDQEIIQYLNMKEKDYQEQKWLNTLFRVGEFSFTYHYISGVAKIFCPDMSYRGKKIRNFNLKISLKALKEFQEDYKATRYFSRVSMLGKIDMSSVWSDYEKLPEKPGYEISNQRTLERKFHADKYQFLYNFKDSKGISYQVIKIDDDTYTMTWVRGRPRFFNYRNPHLFTYFQKK